MAETAPQKKKKKFDRKRAWREARGLMREHRGSLAIGMILMLINRVAGFVLPASSKFLLDTVIGQNRGDLLLNLAGVVGIASIVQALSSFGLAQVVSIAGQRAIADMRKRVEAHVLRLPVRYFDTTQTGVLISRIMSDAEGIRNLVGTGIIQLIGGVLSAILALGVLFWLNWQLTSVTLVLLGIFGAAMARAFARLRPLFRERGAIQADVTGRLAEALGGVRILKVYVAEKREDLVFARGVHKLLRNVAGTITGTSILTAVSTVIVGAISILMIIGGGRAILSGTMTIGDFIMYVFFIGMVAMPLVQIASIGTQISEAFAGLDRIREVRDMATEAQEDAQLPPLGGVEGAVAFEHVWFEYEANTPVLKGVSFRAPAGSTTALVGSSGSGKSTLISLVMAFNKPTRGTVFVDGRDLNTIRLHDYRSQLGVVMQDNFLFDGTIRDNIRYSKPGATDAEVRDAASVAHCDEFVDRFEKKYDTVVGERGVRLSGGQRQRIAIARAILADPRILILDEATSSLDSESEALIRDGLRSLRRGRTTFVIAHRLSTIRSADQILVLEDGAVVEHGTHDELLRLSGRYRQLYEKQQGIQDDQFINPGEDFTPEPASPRNDIPFAAARGSGAL
jgi:ABC-type multidrug transport system fused ATPase/permease subunit